MRGRFSPSGCCIPWHFWQTVSTAAGLASPGLTIAESAKPVPTDATWLAPGPWHRSHPIERSAASGPEPVKIACTLVA